MKYNAMIVRQAANDFDALLIANAMQSIDGVEVVSVTVEVSYPYEGVWRVFAKQSTDVPIKWIDDAIAAAMNGEA